MNKPRAFINPNQIIDDLEMTINRLRSLNAELLEALEEAGRLAAEKAHGPIGVVVRAAIAKAKGEVRGR